MHHLAAAFSGIFLIAGLIVSLHLPATQTSTDAWDGTLHVAAWNVENLFDTLDDEATAGDEEFTPNAKKQYTPERLEKHIVNLTRVIRSMNGGSGPDVLGLCEVENRQVVQMLIDALSTLPHDYAIMHKDSPSYRGIDCALVYDARILTPIAEEFLPVDAGETRDIVHGAFTRDGHRLDVFLNHWPSQAQAEPYRMAAARVLRTSVDALLAMDPAADILLMGDFNEEPNGAAIRSTLRTTDDEADAIDGVLYNTMTPLAAVGEGSYFYKKAWEIIDHIIVSPGLLDREGFHWRKDSTRLVRFDFQLERGTDGTFQGLRRMYSGDFYHADGVSDHLPVEAQLLLVPDDG